MAVEKNNDARLTDVVVLETTTSTVMAKEHDGRPRPETTTLSETRILPTENEYQMDFEGHLADCQKGCNSQHHVFDEQRDDGERKVSTGTSTSIERDPNTNDLRVITRTITLMAKDFDGNDGDGQES
jgi:hypothetical protein